MSSEDIAIRREARRRKILENADSRLLKISGNKKLSMIDDAEEETLSFSTNAALSNNGSASVLDSDFQERPKFILCEMSPEDDDFSEILAKLNQNNAPLIEEPVIHVDESITKIDWTDFYASERFKQIMWLFVLAFSGNILLHLNLGLGVFQNALLPYLLKIIKDVVSGEFSKLQAGQFLRLLQNDDIIHFYLVVSHIFKQFSIYFSFFIMIACVFWL